MVTRQEEARDTDSCPARRSPDLKKWSCNQIVLKTETLKMTCATLPTLHSRLIRALVLATVITSVCIYPAFSEPSVYPTGVTRYDPALAYNCYVLFDGRDGRTHLIDMDGNEVHTWPHVGFPSQMLSPAVTGGRRGDILVQLYDTPPQFGPPVFDDIFRNVEIGELDWSGHVVWKWGRHDAPGGAARENHDWARLENGDTLILSTLDHSAPRFAGDRVHDQAIYAIAPAGKVIWTWRAADHLAEFGFSKAALNLIYRHSSIGGGAGGFLTINSMKTLGPNRWYEAGDKRFNPNNILIGSREASFLAIIDRTTGRIVWRVGPYYPSATKTLSHFIFNRKIPRPLDRLSGQHDPNMIAGGLPGAGDLLVLDNEGAAGYPPAPMSMYHGSRVLEINPVTKNVVWQYTGEDSDHDVWTFDTSFIGSVRRLPNGNTLINEGMNGRFIQVTSKGKIVWEYINPHFARGSEGGRLVLTNWTYRAQPVPYDWAPESTPHEQDAVTPPSNADFHIPINRPVRHN